MPPAAQDPIYLDGHSTTPVAPEVLEAMLPYFTEEFGNPSAASLQGRTAKDAIERARLTVARLLGSPAARVIFTSGATESINLALQGLARARARQRPLSVLVSPVEHKAVLESVQALVDAELVEPRLLSVDAKGRVNLDEVEAQLAHGVDVVCLMKANNEIGNIYPVEEVAELAHAEGSLVLCDATQAVPWLESEEPLYGADLLALSAHKLHGPKGVGALLLRSDITLSPIIYGGGQESGRRSGTQNVPGIVGLARALQLALEDRGGRATSVAEIRDEFFNGLVDHLEGVALNGDPERRLPNNLNVSFLGVPNELLLSRLADCISFSLASACTASESGPSHVLSALNVPQGRIETAVRFGLTRYTTREEIHRAVSHLVDGAHEIREVTGVAGF